MISITSTTSTEMPPFVIDELPSSSFGALRSRVSRVATLDGGSVMLNYGVAESDRTITFGAWVTEDQGARIEAMRAQNPFVNMSTPRGFFSGMIDSISFDNGLLNLTFLVIAKMG